MGNFTGSYRYIRDARIFPVNSQAAAIALQTAAAPNRAFVGDLIIRTDLDNAWFRMNAATGAWGDFIVLEVWEAGLIGLNAIAQFPGLLTVQAVLDDAISGDTAAAGNPFNIQTDAVHDVIAGDTAGLGNAPPLNGSVIALAYLLADGAAALVNYAAPAGGDVVGTNNVVADLGWMQAGAIATAAPAAGDVIAAARAIGETGLQAGVTAGDRVITRVGEAVIALVGAGALAAQTSADETLAVAGMPAGAVILGYNLSAAPIAGSVWSQARNDGAGNIVIRYANITAAPIAVAADAAVIVQWMLTVVI